MRKIWWLALVVLATTGAGAYAYLRPSPAREICSAIAPWYGHDRDTAPLNRPMGMAWSEGFLYLADTENGEIKKFAQSGALVARWSGFERPVAVAVSEESVYVADFLADRITRLRVDGTIVGQWGRHGTGDGAFDAPSGIGADRHGNVYVADFYNHRVQKFSADGEFILQFGGKGRSKGRFRYPTEIAIDDQGRILVADAYNHRVQRYTDQGDYLSQWGGIGFGLPGKWPGWFRLAKALAVDRRGDVYVADAFNRRIQKFTSSGDLLGQLGTRGTSDRRLRYPAGVAADASGRGTARVRASRRVGDPGSYRDRADIRRIGALVDLFRPVRLSP